MATARRLPCRRPYAAHGLPCREGKQEKQEDMTIMRETEEIEELVERVVWFDIQDINYLGDIEEAVDKLIYRWKNVNVVTGKILYKLHKFVLKLKYRLDIYEKLRPRYERLQEKIIAITIIKELGMVIHKI